MLVLTNSNNVLPSDDWNMFKLGGGGIIIHPSILLIDMYYNVLHGLPFRT